jgi:N utilization substance protein B
MAMRKQSTMTELRRQARELALKVLFQMDIGKQPLSEVLDGALAQVRLSVSDPLKQIVHHTRTELQQLVNRFKGEGSSHSARQIRPSADAALNALRNWEEEANELACVIIAETPSEDESTIQRRLDQAKTTALVQLDRIAARESLQTEAMRTIAEIATKRMERMELLFQKHLASAQQISSFAVLLIQGVIDHQKEIDMRLSALATGWALERQAAVDRNIMRLAAYEILFMPDIPTGVSLNEAVELAQKYSTAESGRFVNGVLGALAAKAG